MKLTVLIFVLSLALVQSLSIRSILNTATSLFNFMKIEEVDPNRDCAVHRFPSVDKIDARKLTGDWFEVGRTITKLPTFSSSTWRFQDDQNVDEEAFFFTGRLLNGHCCAPIKGKAISSNTNPGTFVLNYDGIKSKVEEELKVIFSDLKNALVLYGCSRLSPAGNCLEEASFVTILSRHKILPTSILEKVYEAINSVCIDPHTLIMQNTTNTCDFDDLDPADWSSGEWPTCKKTATCTIACPVCCEEDAEGCISCDCGVSEGSLNSSPLCKKDISECEPGCHLEEKSPSCQVCFCGSQAVQAAHPMPEIDVSVNKITLVEECPTDCRMPKIGDQMYCNCTNRGICNQPAPHVNCQGVEERYTFDKKTGTCPAYLGNCEDAHNSFVSVQECLATCADVCELHVVVGKCNEHQERFYYNRVLGTCETFIYGGCEGNENNYKTENECKRRCPYKFEHLLAIASEKPALCNLAVEKGSCESVELKHAYILEADTCVTFPYSGCGGNDNKFDTQEACEAKCKGKGKQKFDPVCVDEVDECLHPCKLGVLEDGCIGCICGATSLRVTMSSIVFIAILWLLAQ